MEELDFGRLRISVQESKSELRIATAGDRDVHITRSSLVGPNLNWEKLARDRFPNIANDFHAVQVYKQARAEVSDSDPAEVIAEKTQLGWQEFVQTVEGFQQLWKNNTKVLVSMQEPTKHGRAEDRFGIDSSVRRGDMSGGKRQARSKKQFKSIGLAVNQFFAANLCQHDTRVSLDNPDMKDTAGEVWFLCLLDYHTDASWQRSRVKIERCKAAYLAGSTLYLLDDNVLVIITANRSSTGKLDFASSRLDIQASHGVDVASSVRSLSANAEFVLITGEKFGFLLFAVNDSYSLIARDSTASDPVKTVGALNGYSFVLGTRGRDIEFWEINPSDRTVLMKHRQTELKPRQTNLSHRTVLLSDTDDLGVFFLYHCPGRLAIGSNRNLISTQKRPDPVLVQLNQIKPVIAMSSFGDLCAMLHYDGETSIWQFAGTAEIRSDIAAKLSFEGRTMGQMPAVQWIAMTHEYVFIMTPNGDLWALNATDRIKS